MAEASDYELLELRIKELEKENSYLRLFKFGMDNMPNTRFVVGNREYCFLGMEHCMASSQVHPLEHSKIFKADKGAGFCASRPPGSIRVFSAINCHGFRDKGL